MRHLDLFSGIGGFALAARWSGFETVAFCEIDQYCQKVLAKHWPQVPIYADIKTLTRQGLEKDGISQPDIITGGFPCQPFSVAGKQRAQDDGRHLWPEMLRIISELHPAWVIGENVPGIISLALDDCLADLESQDYETETFVLPACAVNAPHRRDRVWILANSNGERVEANRRSSQTKKAERPSFKANQCSLSGRPTNREWESEPSMARVVHGIPNRVDRIKGLGNAVVPQLVHKLFEIIKQVDLF